MKKVAWVLVIIGAINWGLVAAGYFITGMPWNIVEMIFGASTVAYIIYLLVGIAGLVVAFGACGCKKCSVEPRQM